MRRQSGKHWHQFIYKPQTEQKQNQLQMVAELEVLLKAIFNSSFNNGQKMQFFQSRVDFLKWSDYGNFRAASLIVRGYNNGDRVRFLLMPHTVGFVGSSGDEGRLQILSTVKTEKSEGYCTYSLYPINYAKENTQLPFKLTRCFFKKYPGTCDKSESRLHHASRAAYFCRQTRTCSVLLMPT